MNTLLIRSSAVVLLSFLTGCTSYHCQVRNATDGTLHIVASPPGEGLGPSGVVYDFLLPAGAAWDSRRAPSSSRQKLYVLHGGLALRVRAVSVVRDEPWAEVITTGARPGPAVEPVSVTIGRDEAGTLSFQAADGDGNAMAVRPTDLIRRAMVDQKGWGER
jgi:hypothetical protein